MLRCIFANAAAGQFLSVNPDDLVNQEADQAMYRAKARSRDEADTGGTGLLEKAI